MNKNKDIVREDIELRHQVFFDYYSNTLETFKEDIKSMIEEIESILAKNTEAIDPILELRLKKGYYDDKRIVFSVCFDRPMNKEELDRQVYNEKRNAEWELAQYEKLKAKFEKPQIKEDSK